MIEGLKNGGVLLVDVFDEIPFREIRLSYYPKLSGRQFAFKKGLYPSRIHRIEKYGNGLRVKAIEDYLNIFGLELEIFKDSEPYTRDLNLLKLVNESGKSKREITTSVGLSRTYFNDMRDDSTYHSIIFRDILDYLGYELAIVQKEETK